MSRSDVIYHCGKCGTVLTAAQAAMDKPHLVDPDDGNGPLTAGGNPVVCDGPARMICSKRWLIGDVPVRNLMAALIMAGYVSDPMVTEPKETVPYAVEVTDALIAELEKKEVPDESS